MKLRALLFAIASLGLLGATHAKAAGALNVGAAVTDLGDPSAFNFLYATPIVPEFGLVTWHFNGDFGLGDGGRDGVSATAPIGTEFFEAYVEDANLSPTLLTRAGGALRTGAGNEQFFLTGVFDCSVLVGGCASLRIIFAFTGSGGEDTYSMLSHLDIEPKSGRVPEPGSLALLGLGIVGLGAVTRRRKRD